MPNAQDQWVLTLESALTPDQAFADMVKAEIEKIARFPYE